MEAVSNIFSSSIGKKFLMAITGIVWYGFIATHMAGNLLIFCGAETFNRYGHSIVNMPLTPVIEIILLVSVVTHVFLGIRLKLKNMQSKPTKYAVAPTRAKGASIASKTMAQTGSIILVFLISHLAAFKYGPHYSVIYNGVEMRDLHRLMVESFSSPGFVAWYVVSLILLGVHLFHGISSSFQSLGLNHPKYTPTIKIAGVVYAVVVAAGFLSQAVYVFIAG